MRLIKPTELDGKTGPDLAHAEEIWIATHKNDVRKAINDQRNYVHQEVHTLIDALFKKEKGNTLPNLEEMKLIVMRDNMDDSADKNECAKLTLLFIEHWRTLMPKVAGHWAWSPNKREYHLLSYGMQDPEDLESDYLVSPSDEAFLLVLWENCYKKWTYLDECRKTKEQPNPKDPKMDTPYSSSKSGQKKFGGWTKEGIQKYDQYLKEIVQNRNTNSDFLKSLEDEVLNEIRKIEKTQEREDSRKSKKKKSGTKKGDFDDISDDENDMDDW